MAKRTKYEKAQALGQGAVSMFTNAIADLNEANRLLAETRDEKFAEASVLRERAEAAVEAAEDANDQAYYNGQVIERLEKLVP